MSEEYNRPIREKYRDMLDNIQEQINEAGDAGLDTESLQRMVMEANEAFFKGKYALPSSRYNIVLSIER